MNNYEKFFQLHYQDEPFIIANAWNVKSAKLIEDNGYKAIATSSGAIANSLGYEDGEKIPFNELVTGVQDSSIIKEITATVPLPVNVVGQPKLSTVKILSDSGVKRISMAGFLYNATYKQLEKVVREIKAEQSFSPLF